MSEFYDGRSLEPSVRTRLSPFERKALMVILELFRWKRALVIFFIPFFLLLFCSCFSSGIKKWKLALPHQEVGDEKCISKARDSLR